MMTNIRVSGTVQPGLSSKPYPDGLGMLVIVSTMISVFSAWLLAFEFLGYHAPGHAPHPTVSILLLILGLTFAAIVFMGWVLKYAMAGKHIPVYPVGLLTIVGGFLLASRALTKYVFNL